MDGVEVLRRLKENAGTAAIPVIMLSDECDSVTMAACVSMGAVARWSKAAVVPAEFSRRVRELLGGEVLA